MIKLIVARASNGVIGKDNDLIWHLPADMRFFTQTTKGNVVIMGRRNWDSIPLKYRPLSDRVNVVVSRNNSLECAGAEVYNSLEDATTRCREKYPDRDIFIIGGGQIYRDSLAKNMVDEMYITEINASFEGDTWFPAFDPNQWEKEHILAYPADEKNAWSFDVYKYSKKRIE